MNRKAYIGDGVYAEFDEGHRVVLTTQRDITREPDMIVLEPEVLRALNDFYEDARRRAFDASKPPPP